MTVFQRIDRRCLSSTTVPVSELYHRRQIAVCLLTLTLTALSNAHIATLTDSSSDFSLLTSLAIFYCCFNRKLSLAEACFTALLHSQHNTLLPFSSTYVYSFAHYYLQLLLNMLQRKLTKFFHNSIHSEIFIRAFAPELCALIFSQEFFDFL